MSSEQKYKVGDYVRFNDGEVDEDSGTNISGWQGRITEINEKYKTLGVALDSITLKQLSKYYLEACEEEGLGWSEYYIEWDSVTKVEPRDTREDVEAIVDELTALVGWSYLGEEGREINLILQGTDGEMEQYKAWKVHILKTVKFPLLAEVSEWQRPSGVLQSGDQVKITGIDFIDDMHGLIASLQGGSALPLADLKATSSSSPYHDTIHLYAVWFANR